MVTIKRYSLSHVIDNNKILFNTNNHGDSPNDYKEIVNRNNTSHWIDLFHTEYHTLTLDEKDLKWMKEAFKIGVIKRKFTHLFDDELEITCKKYETEANKIFETCNRGFFIRTEKVSLKEGKFGVGPYKSLENILKSMVTTTLGHSTFNEDDTKCKIYFMKWIDMDRDKEFRIFICNNKITAISAQHIYSINNWLNTLSDTDIEQLICKILEHFDKCVRNKLRHLENYSMDLVLIGEAEIPYFIEPNSFGAEYAAGSALFHWILDHDVLYGNSPIELRYVDRE